MKVIDVEIHRAIPPKPGHGESWEKDIWYCEGWRDYKGMGIAVVCTFDTQTFLSRAFGYAELEELVAYIGNDYTAGFNTLGFDLPLLAEHGVQLDREQHFDILAEIWKARGLDPTRFNYKTHGGWSLDDICQSTFSGLSKSANGALAPVWWQRGRKIPVVDYCLRDVWMEWQLLRHAIMGRPINNARGEYVQLERKAEWVERLLSQEAFTELEKIGEAIMGKRADVPAE